MAKCKTCGKRIRVPDGWSVGAAARKHYWRHHPERMEAKKADRKATEKIPARRKRS